MTARFATADEVATWNSLLAKSSPTPSIFSTAEYGDIKRSTAYSPRYIIINNKPVLALEKKPWPFGKFWYLPKGPTVENTPDYLEQMQALSDFAKKQGVFLVRSESELPRSTGSDLTSHGYIKANPIIPSQSTILLNISPSLDQIISSLPQKGRYAIRRAERDGVTIQRVDTSEENCKVMYALLSDTAKGQFGIRSFDYYKTYWQTFSASNKGQLFFAYFEGRVVAGAFALIFGARSTYKDGASIRERSAYGASHLLQWEVIQWAKEHGAEIHDLCGSPPSDAIHDKSHPHYNIGLFKTSFSKEVTDYIGCYDAAIRPLRYKLWSKIGERVHRKLYYKKTHDYYY